MISLLIYTSKVFKENRLPVINNSDYSIILYKDSFEFDSDLALKLEVINDKWILKKSNQYNILKDDYYYDECELNINDVVQIYTDFNERISIIVRNIEYPMSVFNKYDLSGQNEITIGKREDMDICYDFLGLVSREHAILYRAESEWYVRNKSGNGIYVNSKLVENEKKLDFGDHISIVGLNIVFLNQILAVDNATCDVAINEDKLYPYISSAILQDNQDNIIFKDSREFLHRAPRNIIKIDKDPVEIESVPAKSLSKQQSILQTLGSSLTMSLPMLLCGILMIYTNKQSGSSSGAFMYTGIIMSVSSALLGSVWTIVNMRNQKKQERKDELHRFDAYSKYLIEKTDEIREKYNNNTNALHTMYKSAEECMQFDSASGLLWNRNYRHEDYLFYRLGLGNISFQAPIVVGKEKFNLNEDSLNEKPFVIKKNFEILYNVPVGIDLFQHKLTGFVGGKNYEGAIQLIKTLAVQIAANNCYTDVKMIFIYDKSLSYNLGTWNFVKWFPHVWSEDKKIRYVASDKQEANDVFYELTKVFRQRDELQGVKEGSVQNPYYIMFLINPDMLEGELIAKYVYSTADKYGLSTVIVSDAYENLPNSCEYIVENDDVFQGKYDVSQEKEEKLAISFDSISDRDIDMFARRLANIYVHETGTGGDIPSGITFFEMYNVNKLSELNVIDRWRKNRTYDNIKGLLGEKAGGAPCYLDVHEKYHGPHGLVAGTTGSGKSETLQTYMLSLAVNYSPDDIGFFIIDYKGGGMANLFNGLPHLIGQISNLSGNQVRRAMVSIKSENRRRQRIFNESGVNNINLYTKLYKNNEVSLPVPHLFIIIDEFAELKREEPDFMRELISVAQVGRSLGVHLILATQKPSGTVDDNIWSNTKFRLCLRVADKQDSNDMLHRPDAAYLTQAGRCYLQVGSDEVFELFQSGFSGASYSEEDTAVEIAKLVTLTGKVDMTGSYAKTTQKEKNLYNWLYTIAVSVANVLNKLEMTIDQCVEYRSKMQLVLEEVYGEFEDNHIEYPMSTYNSARLEDYIKLYYQAMQYEGDPVRNVMTLAEQKKIKLPQEKEKTQLDVVKEYLAVVAKRYGYNHELQLWMPVLPTHLYLDSFHEFTELRYANRKWGQHKGEWMIDIVMGMYDDPQNQSQMPVHLNFSEDGHHAICGMVVSGRSTSLQTITYALINKYTPDYVNIYAIDFSSKMMSAFENAPHVGGVMYEGENEKIAKFFNMLNGILEDRKKLFRGGNYSQYVQVNGVVLPVVFVIIDNFAAFNEKTEEKYLADLVTLSKEGMGHGIYLIVTGSSFGNADIPNRVAENIKTVITTEMSDKFGYIDVMRTYAIDVIPESGIKGRGLAMYGKRVLEYQTALAFKAQDDYSRLKIISDLCEEMNENWSGRKARRIPEIPEKPMWSEFSCLEEYEQNVEDRTLLPVAYDCENASVYSIDLSQIYCYLITGYPRSGKKNFLRVLIQSALNKDCDICIMDGETKTMQAYEERQNVKYVNDEEGIFNYFSELIPEFQRRNKIKNELLAKDMEESEIFEKLSEERPVFIFISDYYWFLKTVYEGTHDMGGFLENITDKGRLHNIYFFAVIGLEHIAEIDYRRAYKLFVENKTGVHFGGNVAGNRVFNFDAIPYKEQSRVYKPGIGITASKMGDSLNKIVVPLARR